MDIVVGTLTASLRVRESRSLKDKRQVVRSIVDKLRGSFHVAASEVSAHEDPKLIHLGIAAIGHEVAAVRGLLQSIQDALRGHPVAEYCQGEIRVGREVV
jgi:uncharacterized protein